MATNPRNQERKGYTRPHPKLVGLRLTYEEADLLHAFAREQGMSIRDWVMSQVPDQQPSKVA
jgi:hypothetical protein